jgi:SMODS-associated and fused to various effectors sensor domain
MVNPLKKPKRAIPAATSLFLYVRAGGRCEFDSCNQYLLEHGSTGIPGNFAEKAHIWAFQEDGPRGKADGRPEDINHISNLMLLCPSCHHLVDQNPQLYPVDTLKKFKKAHEDRVFELTDLAKNRDTVPLVLKGTVGDRVVDISDEEMQSAVAPNNIKRRAKIEIDMNSIPDIPDAAFWKIGKQTIDRQLSSLYTQQTPVGKTLHISVFALAPMPFLIYLGSKLSDKLAVDLFQRNRIPETWKWLQEKGEIDYIFDCIKQGENPNNVALLINLSGVNKISTVFETLGENTVVYEITLKGEAPNPRFLRSKEDLDKFRIVYMRCLSEIRTNHPGLDFIHLFPTVPAPIAIILGRDRLPKIDPIFKVYDRDKRTQQNNVFTPTLEIL